MKHLLSPLDLSVPEIDQLIAVAEDIEKDPKTYSHVCDGKKLAGKVAPLGKHRHARAARCHERIPGVPCD